MTRTTEGADPGHEILTFDEIRVPDTQVLGKTRPLQVQVPKMSEETEEQIRSLVEKTERSAAKFIKGIRGFLTPDKPAE